jgi:HD-like signal output (HDOD) protein
LRNCVQTIFRGEGVPPFAMNANELIALAVDPEGTAAQLTRVILRDLGLTSQVLRVANSSMYNRSGKPIGSVPHAIALLGWESIRHLVSATRFVEHFARGSPGLRELMMMSLMTANHGRELAASVGYPRPEEAYVCSMFRNLGEVLIARYYPREYARILVHIRDDKMPEKAACLAELDFTWQEVAVRLAHEWNLPAQISMAAAGPERAHLATPLDRCLISIAEYGQAITAALYRGSGRLDSVETRALTDPYGRPVPISRRELHEIVDAAVEATGQTFASLQIPLNTLKLERQVEDAKQVLVELSSAETPSGESVSEDDPIPQAAPPLNLDSDLTAFIMHLLGSLPGWGGFRRAVFALLNGRRDAVRGRLGAGEDVDAVLQGFDFSLEAADMPVAAALLRRQSLLVNRSVDGRYDRSELVSRFSPAVFALFPVIVDGTVAGCIYADRADPWAVIPDATRVHVGSIRDLIAGALDQVRSASR